MTETQAQPVPTPKIEQSPPLEVRTTVDILKEAAQNSGATSIDAVIAATKVAADHHAPGPAED